MESIRQIYRIGHGPSSSHTMGPMRAAQMFLKRVSEKPVDHFDVTLYGSLAATGKGHLTDGAIYDALSIAAPVNIKWEPKVFLPFHPNGMHLKLLTATARNWTNGRFTVLAAEHSPTRSLTNRRRPMSTT